MLAVLIYLLGVMCVFMIVYSFNKSSSAYYYKYDLYETGIGAVLSWVAVIVLLLLIFEAKYKFFESLNDKFKGE